MKRTDLAFIGLSGLFIAIVVSLWAPLIWEAWWPGFSFRLSLPIYPDSQQINRAYSYYGADSGLEVLYFWSTEPVAKVQAYYAEFTLPFQSDQAHGWPITAFGVRDSKLTYRDIEGVEHKVDGLTEIRCHYTQRYRCVNVRLVSIDEIMLSVPDIAGNGASSSLNATPAPLAVPLAAGTLIIYSYYINDF